MSEIEVKTKEKMLAEFKVNNEDWSIFELSDGSILKMKFVLINSFKVKKGDGFEASLQSQNVMGIYSPDYLRGKPSDPYTREELAKKIDESDVEVAKVVQQPWSEYEIDDAIILKVKNIPINIARSKKYDTQGMPVYLVESTVLMKTKNLRKKITSKKKKIKK